MFAMAKIMEMTKEEQNYVALYLYNILICISCYSTSSKKVENYVKL